MDISIKIYFFIIFGVSLAAAFTWTNCGTLVEPIRILSLNVYSNTTEMLYVSGRGKVAMNITTPIQGKVIMQKKFFWGWTKIPCVDQIGSCIYDDICDLSPYKEKPCPSEFSENNLPCRCPILQGQYMTKMFPVNLTILPNWLEKGLYRIQLSLFKEETELICLLFQITL